MEAAVSFLDEYAVVIPDEERSVGEARFVPIGESPNGRVFVVVNTEREDRIRIVSARGAEPHEARAYRNQRNQP